MNDYKMEIILQLIKQNPQLKKVGILDVVSLVDKVLKAQKTVDEKIKSKLH